MNSLPCGYTTQPMTMADTSRLTRLVSAYANRWSERAVMTKEHLRVMLSSPELDIATSARLVLDPDGTLVAAGFVFHRDPYVTVHAWGLSARRTRGSGSSDVYTTESWSGRRRRSAGAGQLAELALVVP